LILKQGVAGAAVKALQEGLRTRFPAYRSVVTIRRGELISVDGVYGLQTAAWVKEFQRRSKITVDGIVGPETKTRLASFGVKL